MNWDQEKGKLNQAKGKAQQQRRRLTDYDLDVIDDTREKLGGKIQERFGREKQQADKQVNEWESDSKE